MEGISIEQCPTDEMFADFLRNLCKVICFGSFVPSFSAINTLIVLKRLHLVEDSFLKISRAGQSVADGQTNALRASGSKKLKPFCSSSHSFQLIPS